jgi:hypothetical protein
MSPGRSSGTADRLTSAGEEILKIAKQLKEKPHVKVGILEKDFSLEKKKDAESKSDDWPQTVGAVGVYNEWGTENIPERSFMRSTFDEKRDEWIKVTEQLRKATVAMKMTVKRALGLIGAMIQGDIQKKISSSVPPPNAESTIARKGSSTTLIDTEQMRGSIHFEVKDAD